MEGSGELLRRIAEVCGQGGQIQVIRRGETFNQGEPVSFQLGGGEEDPVVLVEMGWLAGKAIPDDPWGRPYGLWGTVLDIPVEGFIERDLDGVISLVYPALELVVVVFPRGHPENLDPDQIPEAWRKNPQVC